jgi:hypothetical protein
MITEECYEIWIRKPFPEMSSTVLQTNEQSRNPEHRTGNGVMAYLLLVKQRSLQAFNTPAVRKAGQDRGGVRKEKRK